jgi:predicted Rossmann fold nucleotide-binding protein DprA/Smf involved in DNA uptake
MPAGLSDGIGFNLTPLDIGESMSWPEISEKAKITLLLCGVLGKNDPALALTTGEFGFLLEWLAAHQFSLTDVIQESAWKKLRESPPKELDPARLEQLLSRGAAVAFAAERWTNKGVWISSSVDNEYPRRLRDRLGRRTPPIIYGFGDQQLLAGGSLAVVGSRQADKAALKFTTEVSRRAAQEGLTIISGGARGVDRTAMLAALEAGGKVVGVLADSLLKTAVKPEFREAILAKRLALISPYYPEAGFSTGNAMGRNRLIYALSDFALIVNAEFEKGGTWAGATEELKAERRVPVFVRISPKAAPGNSELLKRGAIPFPNLKTETRFAPLLQETAEEQMTQGELPFNEKSL